LLGRHPDALVRAVSVRSPKMGETGWTLRDRMPSDVDELVAVAARVRAVDGYPVYLPGDDYRRFLTTPDPLAAWVVEMQDRIVAQVALNPRSLRAVMEVVRAAGIVEEVGVVGRLLVDPSVRRQGLGRRLLDRARCEAIAQRRVPVLDVVASASAAVGLYQREGWIDIGRVAFDLPDAESIEVIVFRGPR
jgi:[ribosomal protein S18]-alanine N-acetyltransferase